MSEIDEIKEKMKRKLSLDEMYVPDPVTPGFLDVQKPGNLDVQDKHMALMKRIEKKVEPEPAKAPKYKMTFELDEDTYNAFREVYAKRMMKGYNTTKSDLACEAIAWLVKMEDKQ